MSTPETVTQEPGVEPYPRRWRALLVLALVQFMFVLDLTVVNVAIPHIQRDLHFSVTGIAWVVNAYVLIAGGLLLLGGRLGDLLGRRSLFMAGTVVFALASLLAALAQSPAMLVSGRFLQGLGEALAAPSGLGIVARIFQDARERANAVGLWAGMAALGGTMGIIISGLINEWASWRWIFFINLPVAAISLLLVPRLVPASQNRRIGGSGDFGGGILLTTSMLAIVYGLLEGANHAWSSARVAGSLVAGVVLMALFVALEARLSRPLVPLTFFRNRTRVMAALASITFAGGFFSTFFLLTLYLQEVVGWRPLHTGVGYLPMAISIIVGGGFSANLLPRIGGRVLLVAGCVLAGVGLLMFARITVRPDYAGELLPGLILVGLGAGLMFPTLGTTALEGVSDDDSGLAAGVQNSSYQTGGALGLAVLATIAVRHTRDLLPTHAAAQALVDGYARAFVVGAIILLVTALVGGLLMPTDAGKHVTATPA